MRTKLLLAGFISGAVLASASYGLGHYVGKREGMATAVPPPTPAELAKRETLDHARIATGAAAIAGTEAWRAWRARKREKELEGASNVKE